VGFQPYSITKGDFGVAATLFKYYCQVSKPMLVSLLVSKALLFSILF
jgi:hypothetical protein